MGNGFVWFARRKTRAITTAVGGVLVLGLGSAALAAAGIHIVPPSGKVAGTGYAYWLKRQWQLQFANTPPYPACLTMTVNGHKVGYLGIKSIVPATTKYTCSEPVGRPLYVIELSAECSTFHGDHLTFGTSNAQLKRCARTEFIQGTPTVTTTIDGHVVDVLKLVAATGVYPVHVPKNNLLGTNKPGNGRSAAYGPGLLLKGLAKGVHVIHSVATVAQPVKAKWVYTWTSARCCWKPDPTRCGCRVAPSPKRERVLARPQVLSDALVHAPRRYNMVVPARSEDAADRCAANKRPRCRE
jgi:hypothetical protein